MLSGVVFLLESLCMFCSLCFLFYMLYVLVYTDQFNSNVGKPVLLMIHISCILILATDLLFVNPTTYQFTPNDGAIFQAISSFFVTNYNLGLVAYEFVCYCFITTATTAVCWTCFRTVAVLRKQQATQNLKHPYLYVGIPGYSLPFLAFIFIAIETNQIDDNVYYLKYRAILIGTAGCLIFCTILYVSLHLFSGFLMIYRKDPKREVSLVFARAIVFLCLMGGMLAFMTYFILGFDYGPQFVYAKAPYFSLFLGIVSSLIPMLAFTLGRPIKQKKFTQIRVFQQMLKKKIHP